jgi:folate-binding protein YgfZ
VGFWHRQLLVIKFYHFLLLVAEKSHLIKFMNPGERHGFHFWQPAACLRISGEDSPAFLQGQFTNDLQKAKMGGAIYGLWLNQKGKVLADSFIQQKSEHEFWILSYFSPASVIRERLEAYVIADDVVIEDLTAGYAGLTVFGPVPGADRRPAGEGSFPGRRTRGEQTEIFFPAGEAAAMRAKLGPATWLTAAEVAHHRIAAGIPAVPADIGPTELPQEGGLNLEAISYTKGCYLGQEVMARLKSMGQVRRRLVPVRGEGAAPAVPAPVYQAGRKVGELRSVAGEGAGWIGLALVLLLQVQREGGLALTVDGTPTILLGEVP